MFESLDEKIKSVEGNTTSKERLTHWAVIVAVAALLLFGGLFVGLNFLQTS
jgi:Ni,Fe-hydrogenase I cytochrome b subunit